MILLELLFWIPFALIFWTYSGYPAITLAISRIHSRPWQLAPYSGKACLVIAAHNEEAVIRAKINNCLAAMSTIQTLETIVISDGSTDSTNAILDEYSSLDARLRTVTYQPRAGKAHALNLGVSQAQGEVLVFSDANVLVNNGSLEVLLAPFADPQVGAVCGRVVVQARGSDEVAGESLYMRYEAAVQRAEALCWSMIGIDGALFAIRRDLFQTLPNGVILDDFMLAMNVLSKGFRVVYETHALAVEEIVPSAANEFKRKSRIVAGGYQYLAHILKGNCTLSITAWYSFVSHKLLRWLTPFLLALCLLANGALYCVSLYSYVLAGQFFVYGLALTGYLAKATRKLHVIYIPYYFAVVNLAAFLGFVRFLRHTDQARWAKVDR